MNLENLTEDELKDLILQKQLEWIKLCQDDFLIFAQTVWQDFIYRKTKDPKRYGHHQIIAEEFQKIAANNERGSLSICHQDILNQNLHLIYSPLG